MVVHKVRTFVTNAKHVMSTSYKPGSDEYGKVAKIIIIGILAIGFLGFVISLIVGFLTGSPI